MAMMRFVDMMYSIPDMLYVIMIVVVMGPSMSSILIGICISSWMGMARQVRAQVMTLKEQEFSLAAKVLGAGTGRIIFKHLIINSMGPIIGKKYPDLVSAADTVADSGNLSDDACIKLYR